MWNRELRSIMIHYPGIVIHPLCSALCPHYPGDHFCHSINFKFSPFTFTILSMRLRVLLYHYLLQTSFEVIVFHEKHLGALGLKNSRQFPLFQGVGSSEMHLNLNGTQTSSGGLWLLGDETENNFVLHQRSRDKVAVQLIWKL